MSDFHAVTWAEFVAVCVEGCDLKRDLAIAETALEAERQWRLTSLPALLAAEERAVKAEARVAYLEDWLSPPRTFPELRQTRGNRALINAYHESKERP